MLHCCHNVLILHLLTMIKVFQHVTTQCREYVLLSPAQLQSDWVFVSQRVLIEALQAVEREQPCWTGGSTLLVMGGGYTSGVRGYLLCSREGMVETGHISHYGFLIWTSSVHNVYKVGARPWLRRLSHTNTGKPWDKHNRTHVGTCTHTLNKLLTDTHTIRASYTNRRNTRGQAQFTLQYVQGYIHIFTKTPVCLFFNEYSKFAFLFRAGNKGFQGNQRMFLCEENK